MDLRDLAWLEDGIGYATKGSADVEGEHEAAVLPAVGLSCARGGLHLA